MEGQSANLAEQQLVDCDSQDHGCSSGWPESAYRYIFNDSYGGITTTSSYPYTGVTGTCQPKKIQSPIRHPLLSPGYRRVAPASKLALMIVSCAAGSARGSGGMQCAQLRLLVGWMG